MFPKKHSKHTLLCTQNVFRYIASFAPRPARPLGSKCVVHPAAGSKNRNAASSADAPRPCGWGYCKPQPVGQPSVAPAASTAPSGAEPDAPGSEGTRRPRGDTRSLFGSKCNLVSYWHYIGMSRYVNIDFPLIFRDGNTSERKFHTSRLY